MKMCIIKTNKGRLANQLWAYSGIYAYCLSKGYHCINIPFSKYQSYFGINTGIWWVDHISPKLLDVIRNFLITLFEKAITMFCPDRVLKAHQQEFFLPPTELTDNESKNSVMRLEISKEFYFLSGWLFRNPAGEKTYHAEIQSFFKPIQKYQTRIDELFKTLRSRGAFVVGVHIRQNDYIEWNGGEYFFSHEEVKGILEDFLTFWSGRHSVTFVLCSDAPIDDEAFSGLPYAKGLNSEIEDLYTLASCDLIIGSNSTYGSWAAYYGSIPFIQFSREPIDWSIYEIIRTHGGAQQS